MTLPDPAIPSSDGQTQPAASGEQREFVRAVGRWQLVGLSINDVVGSGIYLLPAAAAALLGPASLWGVLIAGLAVGLLVLCFAKAASYFDQPGGSILYAREALSPLVGFEVGWMQILTRISSAAALSNGLADAVTHFWPHADSGAGRVGIIVGSLALLTGINVVGVRSAARTASVLAVAKLVPLLMFVAIGAFFVDLSQASPLAFDAIPMHNLGRGALLLLFAYAGFENLPTAAGEYRNPRRDVPFAMITMISTVTIIYFGVQWVALGTLPGLADSLTPLADASARFGGGWLALVLTVGAAVSILGTNNNTVMFGPRYLQVLAADGYGPEVFSRIHPRFRTPAVATIVLGVVAVALALSGNFVGLVLLSVVARLITYLATTISVMVLDKRYTDNEQALKLPGGKAIPIAALALSIGLLSSAGWSNLLSAAVALLIGWVIYRFWRRPG